jgi:hypothetical protein
LIRKRLIGTTILLSVMLLTLLTPVRSQTWGNPGAAYLQVNSVDLNGGGSQISVSPGDTITGTISYQFWDNGNPSAIWQIWALLGYGNPSACLWSGVPGGQPGVSRTDSWTFSAPTNPGSYPVLIMPIALYGCSDLASQPSQNWPSQLPVGQITVTQSPQTTYQPPTTTYQPPPPVTTYQPPPPTCSGGQYWNGAQCVCPSGQQWNGQQCVAPPPPPTCPSMSSPSIINLSSGNIVSLLGSWFIEFGPGMPPAHLPIAQDQVNIQPSNQYPISWVEIKVREDDSSNYADPSSLQSLRAILQSDGSYATQITVQDNYAKDPRNVAWGIIQLAVTVGASAGNAAAAIIGKVLNLLGILQAAQPPPDVELSIVVIVHYANGLDCPSSSYSLPTFARGVRENWDPILSWFEAHIAWLLSLHSNADILAVDSSGHRVGAVYQNGAFLEDVNEVPGAAYSGHGSTPQILALPPGDYTVTVQGNAPGQYSLMTSSASSNWNVRSNSGQTQVGSTDTYSLSGGSIASTGGNEWSWSTVGLAAAATIVVVLLSSEIILRRRRQGRRRR